MISIIICSRTAVVNQELANNIGLTIGSDFEIISIANQNREYSIFEAYSLGLQKSKGDVLCFIHDDVVFRSNNWGAVLLDCFKDEQIGLLGLIGTHFLPAAPCGWWSPETRSGHIIQGGFKDEQYRSELVLEDKYRSTSSSVVSVDGVFMAMPKHVFETVYWDTKTYGGFHGYDMDMSLQVISAGYRVEIAWGILVEHKSPGVCSTAFHINQQKLYNKWQFIFPIVRGIEMSDGEIEARTRFVQETFGRPDPYGSKEYRLGNALLHPISFILRHMKIRW